MMIATLSKLTLAYQDTAEHAAEHADGAAHAADAEVLALANWLPGLTAIIVFGIAFAILYLKVWPKIVSGLEERQNKIREEIAAAERARAEANSALAEYQSNLAKAREQAEAMIARARADAKVAAEELRHRNEIELSQMKERATSEIDAAKRAAIVELHTHAATLATSIAGKILRREISVDDQQQLVQESLAELAHQSHRSEPDLAGAAR